VVTGESVRRLAIVLASILVATSARADDQRAEAPQIARLFDEITGPKLPPPFALPELTHPGSDTRVDWTLGGAEGTSIGILRPSAEARLGPLRRVYVGASWTLAGATGKVASGNVEGTVRVVFPMPSWLAFGAGVGLVVPTARWSHASPAHRAAVDAASLDPTELIAFTPDVVGIRPVLDMRFVRGPLVAQLRDGLDFALDTATDYRVRTTGRLLVHIGILASDDVELSMEATQLYFFTNGDYYGPDVHDDNRTAMTFGPGARIAFSDVDLGISGSTNVDAPLSDRFGRFFSVRLSIVGHPFGSRR
jgi:hypothetical protein